MEDLATSSARSIFVLYLIVSGNFLANIFGCRAQAALSNSMLLKHLLGFMTMLFFVVLVDGQRSVSPHQQVLLTIAMYVAFVVSTRTSYKYWSTFIVLLCVNYVLEVYKDNEATPDNVKNRLLLAQRVVIGVATAVMAMGVIVYFARKKQEFGAKFDLKTFLIGKTQCAFTTSNETLRDDFRAIQQIIKT